MGAINFDAGEWLRSDDGAAAKAANLAKVEVLDGVTLATSATLAPAPVLPPVVERGLDALARSAAPRGVNRAVWARIVSDAQRLRAEGWCASALALGWSIDSLFGVDDDERGVAIQLQGRTIRALLGEGDTPGARAMFVLDGEDGERVCIGRSTRPARLLWELTR